MRRPQYAVFPEDEAGFWIDDQCYIGSSGLHVKPVTQKVVKDVSVHITEDEVRSLSFLHRRLRVPNCLGLLQLLYFTNHTAPKNRHIIFPANLYHPHTRTSPPFLLTDETRPIHAPHRA